MSKTWGNAIWLTDEPNEMFGKVMSLKDELIIQYFTLATNTPLSEIEEIKRALDGGDNPMKWKKQLAQQIVTELHSPALADGAQQDFEKKFQSHDLNTASVPTWSTKQTDWGPVELLVATKLASSKSDAKRLIEQGAVEINGKAVSHQLSAISLKNNDIIKVGKKKFLKIQL